MSLYTFSTPTLQRLRKFRITSARSSTLQAQVYQIDAQSYDVQYEEPEFGTIDSLDTLLEELPDNSPRFVVLSYSKTLPDGRLSNPLVMVYHRPLTAKQEAKMLYAGCLEQFKSEVSPNRFVEVADEDDWDELRSEVE